MKNHSDTGTCYSKEQLLQIADILQVRNARNMSSRTLGKTITKLLRNNNHALPQEETRPKKPDAWIHDEFKWLNSLDIQAVMKQYERAYSNFRFAGVFPRDFAVLKDAKGKCVVEDMCRYDASKVFQSGVDRIGMVINLDPYGKSGSHWVALMIDKIRKGIFFYDSTAVAPHADILVFMQNMRRLIQTRLKIKMDIDYNRVEKQRKDTECGIFVMAFLALMLETKLNFSEVCHSIPNDAQVHLLRDVFYT